MRIWILLCIVTVFLYAESKEKFFASYLYECQHESASACTEVGFMYDKAIGVPKDDYLAIEYYQKGCTLGDQRGCVNVGVMWEKEQAGRTRDNQAIMKLFDTACQKAYGHGCYFLAISYEQGRLTKKDIKQAYHYYNLACTLEVEEACKHLK